MNLKRFDIEFCDVKYGDSKRNYRDVIRGQQVERMSHAAHKLASCKERKKQYLNIHLSEMITIEDCSNTAKLANYNLHILIII